jgi:hypothetical protein
MPGKFFSPTLFPNDIDLVRIRAPSIRSPPPACNPAEGRDGKNPEKFFKQGVDGSKNGCIVGGSLETKCPCDAG